MRQGTRLNGLMARLGGAAAAEAWATANRAPATRAVSSGAASGYDPSWRPFVGAMGFAPHPAALLTGLARPTAYHAAPYRPAARQDQSEPVGPPKVSLAAFLAEMIDDAAALPATAAPSSAAPVTSPVVLRPHPIFSPAPAPAPQIAIASPAADVPARLATLYRFAAAAAVSPPPTRRTPGRLSRPAAAAACALGLIVVAFSATALPSVLIQPAAPAAPALHVADAFPPPIAANRAEPPPPASIRIGAPDGDCRRALLESRDAGSVMAPGVTVRISSLAPSAAPLAFAPKPCTPVRAG